ncbi:MAG TPA: L,D-transpeptidase, partial [Ktedonobacteraceae bacterium]
MRSAHPVPLPNWVTQVLLVMLVLGMTLLTSACGGDPKVQQQASQNKTQLDQLLQHARSLGVPASTLAPITKQEQQLSNTSAPFSPFNDQTDTNYYQNQSSQYAKLIGQTQDLIVTTTDEFQLQAQNDMQVFQQALASRNKQHIGNLQPFTDQYNNDQLMMSSAKYPKDYAVVSQQAQKAITALGLMGKTFTQLTDFKNTI